MTRSALLLALAAAACAGRKPGGAVPAPGDEDFRYHVAVADDLSRIDVTLDLRGRAPPLLVLGDSDGLPALSPPVATWNGGAATLVRDGESFLLASVGDDASIAWRVDLERLAADRVATRVGRSVTTRPGSWLLRPPLGDAEGSAALTLGLPDGVGASVPWLLRENGTYLLDSTAFRWRGFAAFGRMETHTIGVGGATLSVAVLDRPRAATWPGIERWIAAAANAQTSLWGEFPASHVQVVVRPVSSNQAVPFGETQRGGGRAVIFRVGDEAKDADFARDWVAVHEFAHLGMPAIPDADAWLSEGFIQYYTEVLMGRAGILDERATWDEMVAGFARGRRGGTGRSLADESVNMTRTHSFMRVYWGGAAIALLLDVELRRSSGGKISLDDAMREIRREFTGRPIEATADEILLHLDAWLGRPLFTQTARPLVASREFPDVAETLRRLGVAVTNAAGDIDPLDDTAPDAALRRAIVGGVR